MIKANIDSSKRIGARVLPLMVALALAAGCTQQQTLMSNFSGQINPNAAPMMLQHQCSVTYQGKVTSIDQMTVSGNSLFLTGQPFGLSEWDDTDICDNPTNSLLFASAQEVDTFSPANSYLESWTEGNMAMSAMSIIPGGQFAFTSGRLGSSAIFVGDVQNPQVAEQFPRPDPSSGTPQRDENFQYTAIAVNPTQNKIYGFRKSDFEFTMTASMPEVTVLDPIFNPATGQQTGQPQAPYTIPYTTWMGNGDTCCATNAAVFGSKVFVSFQSSMLGLTMDSNGFFYPPDPNNPNDQNQPRIYNAIQAVNVVSTPNHLYVQHQASYESAAGLNTASGIYVFDTNGNNVAYLDVSPQRFAVSYDDSQIFTYQTDATNAGAVQIYRILWTNQ